MKAADISTLERPEVQASAKRGYVGPKATSKKRQTVKLRRTRRRVA